MKKIILLIAIMVVATFVEAQNIVSVPVDKLSAFENDIMVGGWIYDEDWIPELSYGFQRPSYWEYGFKCVAPSYAGDITWAFDKIYPQGIIRVFRGNVESSVLSKITRSLDSKKAKKLEFDTKEANENHHHIVANWKCGNGDMCGAAYIITINKGYTVVVRFLGVGSKWEGEPDWRGTPYMFGAVSVLAEWLNNVAQGKNFVVQDRMNKTTLLGIMNKPETW